MNANDIEFPECKAADDSYAIGNWCTVDIGHDIGSEHGSQIINHSGIHVRHPNDKDETILFRVVPVSVHPPLYKPLKLIYFPAILMIWLLMAPPGVRWVEFQWDRQSVFSSLPSSIESNIPNRSDNISLVG